MRLPHDQLGQGPPVVLLHAGICDRRMWADTLPALAAAGHRGVAVDLPGFGDAPLDGARPVAPWQDVLDTMDGLGVARAALVGVSWGGGLAARIAAVAPERVAALCLVSARPLDDAPPSAQLQAAFDAETGPAQAGDIDGAVAAVLDHWLDPGAPPALRNLVATMQRRALEVQLPAGDIAEAPDPLTARPDALEQIAAPALVCVGEHDMPDFHAAAAELARRLPGATGPPVTIAGARHLAPLEAPEAFREMLLRFLAGIAA